MLYMLMAPPLISLVKRNIIAALNSYMQKSFVCYNEMVVILKPDTSARLVFCTLSFANDKLVNHLNVINITSRGHTAAKMS